MKLLKLDKSKVSSVNTIRDNKDFLVVTRIIICIWEPIDGIIKRNIYLDITRNTKL